MKCELFWEFIETNPVSFHFFVFIDRWADAEVDIDPLGLVIQFLYTDQRDAFLCQTGNIFDEIW